VTQHVRIEHELANRLLRAYAALPRLEDTTLAARFAHRVDAYGRSLRRLRGEGPTYVQRVALEIAIDRLAREIETAIADPRSMA